MLERVYRLGQAYLAVPVVLTCRGMGVFQFLDQGSDGCLETYLDDMGVLPEGPRQAMLHILSLNGFLRKETGRWKLGPLGRLASAVPSDLLEVYELDAAALHEPHAAKVFQSAAERIELRWNISNLGLAELLDGCVLAAALLACHDCGGITWLEFGEAEYLKALGIGTHEALRQSLRRVFETQGWASATNEAWSLTPTGREILFESIHLRVAASQDPALAGISELLNR